MKILMINKFLYPNGGSETYIFKLGKYLQSHGHEVQYFGMEHDGRCVGNCVNSYTSDMNFHGGNKLAKLTYPIKTIYSTEARKKIRLVLNDFQPDVCHLNNFNYQLTPSIILEIIKWKNQTGCKCKLVFTAHDYQLVCPNHMLNNPNTHENCEKCLGGHFINCTKGKCIHGSMIKSAIGTMESYFWKINGVYQYIDTIICCSEFMKSKMDSNPLFANKTVALHNFIDKEAWETVEEADFALSDDDSITNKNGIPIKQYILYYGRYSEEKGLKTLFMVAKSMPNVQFVFAGKGSLAKELPKYANILDVGFCSGIKLKQLIQNASAVVLPSIWYENCPFSVMESQMYGTPVLGTNIGGIPELIQVGKTGELFERGNADELKRKIQKLWDDRDLTDRYSNNCRNISFDTITEYCEKLVKIYQ